MIIITGTLETPQTSSNYMKQPYFTQVHQLVIPFTKAMIHHYADDT